MTLIDRDTPSSLSGILVAYLLSVGCTVQEIASTTDVTRASVYNWLKGGEARDPILLKLLHAFQLESVSFDGICPQASQLSRSFDPHSLEMLNKLDAARSRFENLLSKMKPRTESLGTPEGKAFNSELLQRYGKAIFEAAFRHEKLGGSLILVCPDADQRESALHIWRDWVRRYAYSAEIEVMNQLGATCPDRYKVFLSDIADSFPTLLRSCQRIFGKETSLRLSLDHKSESSSELILLEFEWETYRDSDSFTVTDYLFSWVSDVDGRRACEKLFHWIKEQIRHSGRSLHLLVHDGYLPDDVMYYNDTDKPDVLLSASDIVIGSIPVNCRIDGFHYGDRDELEMNVGGYVEIEGRKVFVSRDGIHAVDFFTVPPELPTEAFKYLFPVLGYKIEILCDTPQSQVHTVTVSW